MTVAVILILVLSIIAKTEIEKIYKEATKIVLYKGNPEK